MSFKLAMAGENNMDDRLQDKTDFRRRFTLVAELRNDNSARSISALQYLAEKDFVYHTEKSTIEVKGKAQHQASP
ncbi:hypothetical protein ACFL9S_06315 [Erwinia sp. AnSW2-5]|uniref:hypothetical protein n=1 Tax=Erwinia sp. AnSW2-5 TaxID=3367692 RepID=UPI00385BC0E4